MLNFWFSPLDTPDRFLPQYLWQIKISIQIKFSLFSCFFIVHFLLNGREGWGRYERMNINNIREFFRSPPMEEIKHCLSFEMEVCREHLRSTYIIKCKFSKKKQILKSWESDCAEENTFGLKTYEEKFLKHSWMSLWHQQKFLNKLQLLIKRIKSEEIMCTGNECVWFLSRDQSQEWNLCRGHVGEFENKK